VLLLSTVKSRYYVWNYDALDWDVDWNGRIRLKIFGMFVYYWWEDWLKLDVPCYVISKEEEDWADHCRRVMAELVRLEKILEEKGEPA